MEEEAGDAEIYMYGDERTQKPTLDHLGGVGGRHGVRSTEHASILVVYPAAQGLRLRRHCCAVLEDLKGIDSSTVNPANASWRFGK